MRKPSEYFEFFQSVIVLPFLTTEIWLKYGVFRKEGAWAHAIIGAIPAVLYVANKRVKKELIDTVQGAAAISLGIVGVLNENYYAVGAAVLFALAYFNFKSHSNCFDFNCQDMFNYAVSAFAVCGLYAMSA